MSLYIFLGTLSYTGQQMLKENPELMADAVRNTDVPGSRVLVHYAVLGEYDFVMMVEANSNEVAARLSLEFGIRTGLHLETLPALSSGTFTERNKDLLQRERMAAELTPVSEAFPEEASEERPPGDRAGP